jgi:hypothetical protein
MPSITASANAPDMRLMAAARLSPKAMILPIMES